MARRLLILLLMGNSCRLGFDPVAGGDTGDAAIPDAAILDAAPPDAAILDAETLDGDIPDTGTVTSTGTYSLFDFGGFWTLPHTVAWTWSCTGTVADFARYELCLDPTPPSGRDCLGPTDDFTLGVLECGGPDALHLLTVNDLEPETTYRAQVRVHSDEGLVAESSEKEATTLAQPASDVPIFLDDCNCTLAGLRATSANPAVGTTGLEATATSEDWLELHVRDLTFQFPDMTQERFEAAYVELFLDAPEPRMVWLFLQSDDDIADYAPPAGYASADGRPGYQRIEVPISRMLWRYRTGPLQMSDLPLLNTFIIGSRWGPGPIYIDEIRIWY